MAPHSYTAEDVFWGELGGCLEMLHAGTTTVVDHAHVAHSPEHSTWCAANEIGS
jgi:cytosine/adenosine deaminase-related metal-dependent hydrolase